ncbi:DNA-binding MarR family transcriptional regulator [Diaminobutyricimonas aerilata]|uniref:DNA-binding MarR family transcriptional regulator n=1 Tax=Diaminobutyricimonas aerilata TaxID=1162967 RepID=A0A2M9CHY0_9MICO|nr:MarR family transcriptional regulator [Diaminobutyricimonas aerilata]PJJ71465.1 DNA-binding MarR family transcriptional regulator [Diaminobutyricimonas aerilata]
MSASRRNELPTSEEFAVWSAYIQTVEILRARVQARLQADSGLSEGDYKVLLTLSEAEGKSLRSSELAAHIEWERSRLSGHLGRMERRGLIRREPSADDARGSRTVLTDDGARAFRASTIPHLRAIKTYFIDAFSDEQMTRIDETTTTLRAHLGLAPMPGRSRT